MNKSTKNCWRSPTTYIAQVEKGLNRMLQPTEWEKEPTLPIYPEDQELVPKLQTIQTWVSWAQTEEDQREKIETGFSRLKL